MKVNLQDNVQGRAIKSVSRAAVMLFAIGIAAAPSMFAKPKAKKAVVSNMGVIAHLQLDGGTATRMFLLEKNGKDYLYVGGGSASGVCILDVTKPAAPRMLEKFAGAGGAQAAEFQLVGDTLAVTSRTGETSNGSSDAAGRSVTIVNTTDPANPQPIQTFSGVTSVVADNVRGLIYLSNGDGLWVVQAKQPQKADAGSYAD
jgi:hypothetical protein